MERLTPATPIVSARAGITEDLLPPIIVPKAPERNYFLFGEVIIVCSYLILLAFKFNIFLSSIFDDTCHYSICLAELHKHK